MDNRDIVAARSILRDNIQYIAELRQQVNGNLTKTQIFDVTKRLERFRRHVYDYIKALYDVEAVGEVVDEINRVQKIDSHIISLKVRNSRQLDQLIELVNQF